MHLAFVVLPSEATRSLSVRHPPPIAILAFRCHPDRSGGICLRLLPLNCSPTPFAHWRWFGGGSPPLQWREERALRAPKKRQRAALPLAEPFPRAFAFADSPIFR